MQTSDYSIMELHEKNILSFSPYLPEDDLHRISLENAGALGLVKDGTSSCGALMYSVYQEEGICFLDSICVDESQRGQGLGQMLCQALEEKMISQGLREIRSRVVIPEENGAESFLEAQGYDWLAEGELYYDIPLKELVRRLEHMKGRMKKGEKGRNLRVMQAAKLPREQLAALPKVPFDKELSFVLTDDRVVGYALVSAVDGEGVMIRELSFTYDSAANHSLLYAAVSQLYTTFDIEEIIHFTVAEGGIRQFLEIITGENEEKEISVGLVMSKTIDVNIPEAFSISPSALLIPRLNGLMAMLAEFGEGYEAEITEAGGTAELDLIRPAGKRPVSVFYEVADPERAEGYDLHIISDLSLRDLSEEDQKKVGKWMEESTLVSFSRDEDEHLFIRTVYPEMGGLIDPPLLKTLLDGFTGELDHLSALDRIAS